MKKGLYAVAALMAVTSFATASDVVDTNVAVSDVAVGSAASNFGGAFFGAGLNLGFADSKSAFGNKDWSVDGTSVTAGKDSSAKFSPFGFTALMGYRHQLANHVVLGLQVRGSLAMMGEKKVKNTVFGDVKTKSDMSFSGLVSLGYAMKGVHGIMPELYAGLNHFTVKHRIAAKSGAASNALSNSLELKFAGVRPVVGAGIEFKLPIGSNHDRFGLHVDALYSMAAKKKKTNVAFVTENSGTLTAAKLQDKTTRLDFNAVFVVKL